MENEVLNYSQNGNAETIASIKDLFLTMNEWGVIPIALFFTFAFFLKMLISDKRSDKNNARLAELFQGNIEAREKLSEAIREQTGFFKENIKQQNEQHKEQHKEIIDRLDEIKENQVLIITDKICGKIDKGEK